MPPCYSYEIFKHDDMLWVYNIAQYRDNTSLTNNLTTDVNKIVSYKQNNVNALGGMGVSVLALQWTNFLLCFSCTLRLHLHTANCQGEVNIC